MPDANADQYPSISNCGDTVRIHAFEFGSSPRAGDSRFHDLRATSGFPASAAWRARLGGLGVRTPDLWRLIHPATADGAIIVWPASPALKLVPPEVDNDDTPDSAATRVISLIRVDVPNVRAARRRAALNVRSIATSEQDWQHYAPALAVRASALLRTEFDAIVANDGMRLQLPDVARREDARNPGLAAEIAQRPIVLSRHHAASECEFWELAAEALALLPGETRGRLSFASGFAPPFALEAVRYVPCALVSNHPDINDVDLEEDIAPAGAHRRLAAPDRFPSTGSSPESLAKLCAVLSNENGMPLDLINYIARYFGGETREIERQLHAAGRSDRQPAPLSLDLLDDVVRMAFHLPVDGSAAGLRTLILGKCEDHLIGCFARNGFLGAEDLRRLQSSPVLAALVRQVIEERPHTIVARLRVSLTMLAHSGSGAVELLDACLRVLLPPNWPASDWLALFDADWEIRRALAVLRRARGPIPASEFVRVEGALLDRLSCGTLTAEPARRRCQVRMLPQISSGPVRHPA